MVKGRGGGAAPQAPPGRLLPCCSRLRADRLRARPADEDSEGWLGLCYADESLITQIAGTIVPRDITGTIARQPSSSSTLPSLTVAKVEALDVRDGHRILEIGAGTGYNAAVLAHRVGAENVTTIETDPDVAAGARQALAATR
ncbi:rRNA adenine N-6-methyltransferase family protein [Streptomyces sp. 8K308]|uniref:rRNA adenine N-6-methyltransferase family protein n=1 Tax=Streptomyces sp. 8K308 TaxID=2530388 RepID=UPI001A9FB77B|nr:rRNA adenine N-6-methyltransferase family protein [Streptomyces sp. 8K308]